MKSLLDEPVQYEYLLIDSLNVATASFYYNQDKVFGNKPIGMLYGSFYLLTNLRQLYPEAEMYFLWEGYRQTRKKEYPDYKANRPKRSTENGYGESLLDFKQALSYFGCTQVRHDKLEADDLAAYYCDAGFEDSAGKILLVSNDQDWWQFVEDRVDVYYRGTIHNEQSLHYKLEFPPGKMAIYKIIRGDKSDNIKAGVPRMPEKHVLELARKLHSYKDLYIPESLVDAGLPQNWIDKMKSTEILERLKKNTDLVLPRIDDIWAEDDLIIDRSEIDKARFNAFMESRGLLGIQL